MLNGYQDVKPWKEALLDAVIVAFYALVASLIALGFPPDIRIIYVSMLAGAIAFLGSLIAWRRIRQPTAAVPEEIPLHRL